MLPHGAKGGGVLALFQQWLKAEKLCLPDRAEGCEDATTMAISGGDNWTGPAISSFFLGKPMAETMRSIGYSCSAMGNHELDFGQPNFAENARIQGYDFLSANVHWAEGRPPLPVKPFVIVKRNQVRIGVVGLSTTSTPTHLLPSASEGLTFEDEEQTLTRVIPEAWNAGADLVVVTAHVCPDVMQHIVGKHPEWNVAFVGAGHCHALKSLSAGKVPVLEPAAELTWYVRVPITVDLTRPQRDRVLQVQPQLVELGAVPSSAEMLEPVKRLHSEVQKWKTATDEKLGEVIGFSGQGMTRESPAMIKWLLGAWRKQLRADVAIMNRHGMRQDLGPGEVHISDLWNILPFNNKIVTMKLAGRDLIDNAECCSGLIDGMKHFNNTWVLSDGRKVDPASTYLVVTPDYSFFGGAGFRFQSQATDVQFGADWRDPVVEWTKARKSTRAVPIETLVFR
jgi:2',3'-cyclic-nucleotide 2'-phosphodiesterase (5'-nucleotidase family)